MGKMIGCHESVPIIVSETVLVLRLAAAADVGAPLHGGDVAVVLGRGTVGRALIVQRHAEDVGQLVAPLQATACWGVHGGQPTADVVVVVEALEVVETRIDGDGGNAVVVAGVQALVCQAVEFVVHGRCGDHPVVAVDLVAGKAQPSGIVVHVFLPDGVCFQRAAGRGGRVVAPGFGDPVGEVISVRNDVCATQVVLFVDLDEAVFLVVVGARGQENAGGGAVVVQDTRSGGSGLPARAQEGRGFIRRFCQVGVRFVRGDASIIAQVIIIVIVHLVHVQVVVGREAGAGIVMWCGGIGVRQETLLHKHQFPIAISYSNFFKRIQ